jgi:hypothetical protein
MGMGKQLEEKKGSARMKGTESGVTSKETETVNPEPINR